VRPGAVTVLAGGDPGPARLAALAAAATALIEDERDAGPADPLPAAYRSRWRRAALIESSEVPAYLKDDGAAWAGGS
jgi:hypothetical protein